MSSLDDGTVHEIGAEDRMAERLDLAYAVMPDHTALYARNHALSQARP